MRRVSAPPSLLTRPFRRVVLATHACFLAFGLTLPVLPRFVVDELGGAELAVGTVFAVHALAAVAARPLLGAVGDRHGRRPLVVVGGAVTAVALLGHLLVDTLALLLVLRALAGAGQAAVVVGAATRTLDLAPAERHGEAASYTLIAIQLGFGVGPLLGELLLRVGAYPLVWVASALLGGLVTVLGVRLEPDGPARSDARGPLLHPRAIVPGVVFAIGSLGFIGFLAFVPLHAGTVGITAVAPAFLVCSGTIVAVRLLAARLPDRIGPRRVAAGALLAVAAGLATIAAGAALSVSFAVAAGAALVALGLVLRTVPPEPVGPASGLVPEVGL